MGETSIRMEVRVQRSSYGSSREGLNELDKGVLCGVSQILATQ